MATRVAAKQLKNDTNKLLPRPRRISGALKTFAKLSSVGLVKNKLSVKVSVSGFKAVFIIHSRGKNTKIPMMMEKMMKWFDNAYGIKYVSLRYFNAAGAYFDGSIGEDHKTETHLIPLILQVPLGKRSHISIFGNDYDTKDGTCIRDYIHVMDLASAHYKALEYLRKGNDSDIFNLGNGNGYSVKEVIDVARKVTNFDICAVEEPRRSGDPAVLIASSEKAKSVLGWKPEFDSLEKIIEDAWNWHKNNVNGYATVIDNSK